MSIFDFVITVSAPAIASQSLAIIPNTWKYDEGAPEKNTAAETYEKAKAPKAA